MTLVREEHAQAAQPSAQQATAAATPAAAPAPKAALATAASAPAAPAPASTKMHISHLNVFYGNTQALEDITLDIYEHSVLALIGPSGCGKSTFLRCLNRMNDTL